jgi:hypothetical protein
MPGANQRKPFRTSRDAANAIRNAAGTNAVGSHSPAKPASSPKPAHKPSRGDTSICCARKNSPSKLSISKCVDHAHAAAK